MPLGSPCGSPSSFSRRRSPPFRIRPAESRGLRASLELVERLGLCVGRPPREEGGCFRALLCGSGRRLRLFFSRRLSPFVGRKAWLSVPPSLGRVCGRLHPARNTRFGARADRASPAWGRRGGASLGPSL